MKTTTIFLLAIAATAGLQAQTTVSTVPVFLEDFEVYSSYTFVTPGTATAVNTNLYTEGAYTILANPSYSHNLYASFTDHSGIGKMLVANGKQTAVGAPDNVWSRRIIGLTKGASYKAKLYATSV